MNKKWICIFLFVFVLSGCLNKEAKEVFVTPVTPETESKFLYKPGTYRAEGSGYHGPIVVDVTVDESSILSIEVVTHVEANYLIDAFGNPIGGEEDENVHTENENFVTNDPDKTEGETPENGNGNVIEIETEEIEVLGAMDGTINMILLEQNTNVDVVTHATTSCNGLKEAVSRALAEALL